MDLKEQYFGTEIEMTGITREEAANAVGELFGTQPYYIGTYYSTWGVRDLEGKEWKFTYDGSIHTQRRNGNRYVYADSEYSTEMVSPKLEYGEMEKLQQVVRCLRSHGGKVNSSLAISAQAINQKCTHMRKTEISENPCFTFRTFLLRLGLIGPEYKNVRKHLLDHLEGDKAWRYDKNTYECLKRKQEER